jgi:Xaa-Pro aminopeptidase
MSAPSTKTSLPPISYAGRVDRVRAASSERGVDGVLVTDLVNVRWLTGFTGSSGRVLITPDAAVLVTDGRYGERASDELAAAGVDVEIRVGFTRAEQDDLLVDAATGLTRIGAEAASLDHETWQSLAARLAIEPVGDAVTAGRRVKDAGEIARIAEASRCADAALAEVAPMLGDGLTEADVRNELEYRMRLHGADGPSYDTIVASGPHHAARPHHHPERRTIVEGDTVVIDVGALVDGYHSDMTRSYVVGEPTPYQLEIYDLLHAVQLAGLAAVSAGTPATEVDAACRSMITEAGYGEWFLHSTGHGVGLQIHEDPFESLVSTAVLLTGDVVTVEPGLYRVGFGGFRIEDLVEVTEASCRVLTQSPKDTPCLPSPPTT